MTFSSCSSFCTPFTSIIPPPLMDTLTSCLIVPIPLATLFEARKSRPSVSAIFLISCGLPETGSNAISTSGIPSLSKL